MLNLEDKYAGFREPQPLPRQSDKPDNWEKGKMFEEYIINLFNKRRFHVREWRKSQLTFDKSILENCQDPDIEMIFFSPFRGRMNRFAVECKWRAQFINGRIRWASDRQICNYLSFEHQWNMSVYVAIGIGGQPNDPDRLFVTPLRNISYSRVVFEKDLIPYNRHPKRGFFFDPYQLSLF